MDFVELAYNGPDTPLFPTNGIIERYKKPLVPQKRKKNSKTKGALK